MVSGRTVKATVPWILKVRNNGLPGDLQNAVEHYAADRSGNMFLEEPACEILSVVGKYGPFRDALLQCWRKPAVQAVPAVQPSVEQRAARLLHVLRDTLYMMDGDAQLVWTLNCGRSVSRVLGWLAMLGPSRLHVIRHVPRGGRLKTRCKVYRLGAAGTPYIIDTAKEQAALDCLRRTCLAADAMTKVMRQPITTCKGWSDQWAAVTQARNLNSKCWFSCLAVQLCLCESACAFASLTIRLQALEPIKAPGMSTSSGYVLPWTFRTMALCRMRTAGIKRLAGTDAWPARRLFKLFPDQNHWLKKLYTDMKASTRKTTFSSQDLADHLCYDGPIELLAMDLCFAGDRGLLDFPLHFLRDNIDAAVSVAKEHLDRHHQHPHPVILCGLIQEMLEMGNSRMPAQ